MEYTDSNKEAWEEAFGVHKKTWDKKPVEAFLKRGEWLLSNVMIRELERLDFKGKVLAQFCCNNGRELLSALKLGGGCGFGFDIAENYIKEARRVAGVLDLDSEFVVSNVLTIPEKYKKCCDILFLTIGALCWFKDLFPFFSKAAELLKPGGWIIINEGHPVCNMLAAHSDDQYDAAQPDRPVFSYFRTEPWIENKGMDYIGGTSYKSKTFYSFTHPLSNILNNLCLNGFSLDKFEEFNYDITGMFPHLSKGNLPLSYLLTARLGPR